jgi:hypothetical protein
LRFSVRLVRRLTLRLAEGGRGDCFGDREGRAVPACGVG